MTLYLRNAQGGNAVRTAATKWRSTTLVSMKFAPKSTSERLKMSKINKAIEYVEMLLEDYKNPGTYCGVEYYERCRAKADVLEDVLTQLKAIKESK